MPEHQEISDDLFPSNSLKSKIENPSEEKIEKKKIKRIVRGRARRRKKSLGSSFAKTFFGDDTRSVGSYILYEVLIPALKNTINDIVAGGVDMLLFGEGSGGRSRRHRERDNRSIVSYSSYYKDRDKNRPSNRRIEHTRTYHARTRGIEEIIIEDRVEAEEVLEALVANIEEYGVVSVDDLMDLVGFDQRDWTDTKWGWDDLRGARVRPVRGGYMLDLPDPISIEN